MPELSFYILSSDTERERSIFCCKLIEKAYRQACFCYVLTDSDNQSRMLDDLLWTFRPNSFIPHQLYTGQQADIEKTVLIGTSQPPKGWQNIIINLSTQSLQDLNNIGRLFEILDNNPQRKQAGRNRYREYQQQGMKINTHHL